MVSPVVTGGAGVGGAGVGGGDGDGEMAVVGAVGGFWSQPRAAAVSTRRANPT